MTFKLLKRKPNFFLILVNKDGNEELITNSIKLLSFYLTEDYNNPTEKTKELMDIVQTHLISEVNYDNRSFKHSSSH